VLTNQLRRSAAKLIQRYAQRMLIENNIEDVFISSTWMPSSAVAIKVNCDVQLTLMGSSLYRYLCQRIGHGYERVNRSTCSAISLTPRRPSISATGPRG